MSWSTYAVHKDSDVQKPRIPQDSHRAAVLDDLEGTEIASGLGEPHNPFQDDIVVYVTLEIAEMMRMRMRVQGVWGAAGTRRFKRADLGPR